MGDHQDTAVGGKAQMHLDDITHRAQADLTLVSPNGDEDPFLWEHSRRVARSALSIATLPMVQPQHPDEVVVYAAACYHAAGWAVRVRCGDIDRSSVLLSPLCDALAEDSAAVLESRLADILSPERLRRAARAVRTLHERDVETIEARIVAEARALEEFGLVSLWPTIRKGLLEGKGVQAAIDTWRRKHEYHFWPARLKDSFRYEPVRELARQRLAKLEAFMDELAHQHCGDDVSNLTVVHEETPLKSSTIA